MKENLKIGIITGKKLTDALMCQALVKKFPNIKIIQYQIPFKMWIPWIWKRILGMGCIVLFGHIFLSAYLRLERTIELLHKKPLWLKYIKSAPTWNGLNKFMESCFNEESLIKKMNDVNIIILTDSFRFSHNFFRQTKARCLQLVWGLAPNYMGDSAGFWAFATEDKQHVGISIIERFSQFNKVKIKEQKIIETDRQENLRSVKIKQAIKMAEILPKTIKQYLDRDTTNEQRSKELTCRIFQAPTLQTYLYFLRFHKIDTLPKYSYTDSLCTSITTK